MRDNNPCLDVTLRSPGLVRFWRIADGRYERLCPPGYSFGTLLTAEETQEKRREFDAEIATSRSEGWA